MYCLRLFLSDSYYVIIMSNSRTVINLGEVLVEVLKQAVSQGRITCGVFECVEILET